MIRSLLESLAACAARVLPTRLRRFARNERGATAVEFALIALPFLALTFMTIETAVVFLAQETLETAASEAGRQVMTGQAQSQSLNAATFKAKICGQNYVLIDCANGLYVDVRTYASFGAINTGVQLDGGGNPVTAFQPGAAGDIVVVRLMYQWPIVTPLAQPYLADTNSTKRLLVATAAFRNEPF